MPKEGRTVGVSASYRCVWSWLLLSSVASLDSFSGGRRFDRGFDGVAGIGTNEEMGVG